MTNWDWPQYLLAGYWAVMFVLSCGVTIGNKGKLGIAKAWPHYVSLVFLNVTLWFGGFWS